MELKRRDAPPSTAVSPASEPVPSRRRGAAQKRKSNALNSSNSSSTPSKRATREKAFAPHTPSLHYGPLTRARQIPTTLSGSAKAVGGGDSASAPVAVKNSERVVPTTEEINKGNEFEALETSIEAQFEAIRSRGANAHVVPTHCELDAGDLDARQEVIEFLDYWGLINFHPSLSMGSDVAGNKDDGTAEKNSLLEKLYRFESPHFLPTVPKTGLMTPVVTSGLFPESTITEELVKQEGPSVEYHCNSCSTDCSRKRYHCQKHVVTYKLDN